MKNLFEATPFLDGQVACFQPVEGYRFSVDALLLAWFALKGETPRENFVELCAGCGIVSVLLAKGGYQRGMVIELQEIMCLCARKTLDGNGLAERLLLHETDLRDLSPVLRSGSISTVVANPPYYRAGEGRVSPNRCEAVARHELECNLADVLSAARYVLPPGGRYLTVYPARRLGDLMVALPAAKLRPSRLALVHPRPDRGATHALMEAVKAGRQGLEVLPPVITHGQEGGYGDWYRELAGFVTT